MLPCTVHDLLPHHPPMRMADRLLNLTGQQATVEFTPYHSLPFWDEQCELLPVAFIEIAAQACAAMQGYIDHQQGIAPRQGFLVGVDRFNCNGTARHGETLFTCLQVVAELDGFLVVDAKVYSGQQELAAMRFKAYAPPHHDV